MTQKTEQEKEMKKAEHLATVMAIGYNLGMKLRPEQETQIGLLHAGYDRGYADCAHKIYQTIRSEMEKNKNEDWRSLLAILESYLTGGKDAKK